MSTYERGYRSQVPGKTGGSSETIWYMRKRGHSLMYISENMGIPPELIAEALSVAAGARCLETSEVERALLLDQLDMLFQKTYELANMSDEKVAASHMRNAHALLIAKARILGIEGVAEKTEAGVSEVDIEIKRLIRDLDRAPKPQSDETVSGVAEGRERKDLG